MTSANVHTAQFELEGSEPPGYRAGEAPVGRAAGGRELTVRLYEVPPQESLCPYHYEFEEEWLLVLDGEVVLRTPAGERTLPRGELVCFPRGPTGAHKVTNRSDQAARVLMFSSSREPAVAVYPDSDKVGVWPGSGESGLMLHRSDGNVEYWDGER